MQIIIVALESKTEVWRHDLEVNALVALPEDEGLIPRTQTVAHNFSSTSVLDDLVPFSGLYTDIRYTCGTETHMRAKHLHIKWK